MKQIVNNLLYDTLKSKCINLFHEIKNNFFYHKEEWITLYITEKRNFFLHKLGFKLIFFISNEIDEIIPLTDEQALKYMIDICPDKIEKYFKIEKA